MSLKNLRDKAGAAADFAIDRKPPTSTEPRRTVTGPGGVAFASMAIEEHQRKADESIGEAWRRTEIAEIRADGAQQLLDGAQAQLKIKSAELKKWDNATPVKLLDPKLIRRSLWANRSEAEFKTKEFAELKADIESAGGNVQPIKVRVFDCRTPHETKYEVIYGHRRHQACLDLGLPVSALVVEHFSDKELFEEMDRENRSRKNLSPWEQGRMYQQALDAGLYPSIRKMSELLGIGLGNASTVIQIARLPSALIEAFPSPLDIQFRWAKPLTDAVQKNKDEVFARIEEVRALRNSMNASEIFELLIAKKAASIPVVTTIDVEGKKLASVNIRSKGKSTVEFEVGALSPAKESGLAEIIRDYLIR